MLRVVLLCILAVAAGPSTAAVDVARVASGLVTPVEIANAGDGSGRLFVVEQGGRVRILRNGQLLPQPFLDVRHLVAVGSERGLLGIAFHPRYAENGRVFVNYTRAGDGATVIAAYRVSADPDIADPASAQLLLTLAQPFENHNGGSLRFGPDGRLYIGLGDGGSANDPGNRAQDPQTLLGKMLRIDVDAGVPYGIPGDNPYASGGGRAEIFASGLRNPWKFSFDRATRALVIADVGQDSREEVDYVPAGEGAGWSFGWRALEGTRCTQLNGTAACADPRHVPPVLEYTHDFGCSITGGYVYRGTDVPELAGRYVYGDFCSGRFWTALVRPAGAWNAEPLFTRAILLTSFGEDEAGELYFADAGRGEIWKLVSTTGPGLTVIEYYHAALDHYFITPLASEIAALDSGMRPGWQRTGATFRAWSAATRGASPVCRFYIPPARGDSHFLSASPAECADVRQRFPALVLEAADLMWMGLPDPVSGACAGDAIPVYRTWNNRADSNHRYTSDRALRDAMVARGSVAEGYGPDAVAMCALP